MTFKAIKKKDKKYKSTRGLTLIVAKPCKYSVIDDNGTTICNISDYLQDPKQAAFGLAKLLNTNRKLRINFNI